MTREERYRSIMIECASREFITCNYFEVRKLCNIINCPKIKGDENENMEYQL